jgi:hypothetical protein
LQELVETLVASSGELWKKDSSGLFSLNPPPALALPPGIQAERSRRTVHGLIRTFAAGAASFLLIYHTRIAPPVHPLFLGVALAANAGRMHLSEAIFVEFLDLLYSGQALAPLIRNLDPTAALGPLQTYAQLAELHVSFLFDSGKCVSD